MNSSTIYSINKLELEQSRGLKDKITDHAQEFLNAFGLTHVWVAKMYFDGRYLDLTNDLSWKEKMVQHQFYSELWKYILEPLKLQQSKPIFSGWQAEYTSKPRVFSEIYDHGVKSAVSMTITCSDHVEHYSFGSNKEILVVNGNLPEQDELMMFYLYLRENILQDRKFQNPILGDSGYSFSLGKESNQSKKYSVPIPSSFSFSCNEKEGSLTQQQIVCLGLLARGYGVKDIAQRVELSPRTVESYIINIKRKYDNPSTAKLITTFNDSPLACVNPFMLQATKSNKSEIIA